MANTELVNLHFDRGNGATFEVEHNGKRVRCFVRQDNAFLSKKASPGQDFPVVFERYSRLIAQAAHSSIMNKGISSDPWGNLVTGEDIENVQRASQGKAI